MTGIRFIGIPLALIVENDDNILYSTDAKKGNEPSAAFDSAEQDGCHVVKGGMPA